MRLNDIINRTSEPSLAFFFLLAEVGVGNGGLTEASGPPPPPFAAPLRSVPQTACFKQQAGSAVNPLAHSGPGDVHVDLGGALLQGPEISWLMEARQLGRTRLIFIK